jgi:2-amino-4-hydroxy-6-hydroxymethyldihydropteridine diphosphokinase
MNKAYLLTGGNLGNTKQNLQLAAQHIEINCGKIVRQSAIYETAAWGNTQQPAFLNQVLELATSLNPEALMTALLQIEGSMGRIRAEKYGPRLIDIDVLLYNQEIIHTQLITVPHPELANRRFVLVPLAEIAPGLKHPVLQKTIQQLLQTCPDQLAVKKFSGL